MIRQKRRWVLLVLLILVAAILLVARPQRSSYQVTAPNDLTKLTTRQWQADLRYLVAQLPKRHPNAFFAVDKAQFEQAAEKLASEMDTLDQAKICVRLTQLLAMIGDTHTSINALSVNPRPLPISLTWLTDGLFVTAVQPGLEAALGARLIRIGSASVDDAYRAAITLVAPDNEACQISASEQYLAMGSVLQTLGLAPAGETINVGLADAKGREFALDLPLVSGKLESWVTAESSTPLYRTRGSESFWFEYLAAERTVYVRYRRCKDAPGMLKLSESVWQVVDSQPVDRVIVDLRGNGGGNSEVIAPLLKGLSSRPALAEHGRIFALIDRRTFSSALMNSIQLRDQAHAILIGEPTGGRPNHYGDVRTFRLPNSGLTVFHSTKHFTMQAEDTPSLMPHITVQQSSVDYLAGRDPVLAAALAQPVK